MISHRPVCASEQIRFLINSVPRHLQILLLRDSEHWVLSFCCAACYKRTITATYEIIDNPAWGKTRAVTNLMLFVIMRIAIIHIIWSNSRIRQWENASCNCTVQLKKCIWFDFPGVPSWFVGGRKATAVVQCSAVSRKSKGLFYLSSHCGWGQSFDAAHCILQYVLTRAEEWYAPSCCYIVLLAKSFDLFGLNRDRQRDRKMQSHVQLCTRYSGGSVIGHLFLSPFLPSFLHSFCPFFSSFSCIAHAQNFVSMP